MLLSLLADAEFNFQQCSFLSELHILQIFLPPKHPSILRSSFLSKGPRFIRDLIPWSQSYSVFVAASRLAYSFEKKIFKKNLCDQGRGLSKMEYV